MQVTQVLKYNTNESDGERASECVLSEGVLLKINHSKLWRVGSAKISTREVKPRGEGITRMPVLRLVRPTFLQQQPQ